MKSHPQCFNIEHPYCVCFEKNITLALEKHIPMKSICTIVFSVFVLLTACKKDKEESTNNSTSASDYHLSAPSCLISYSAGGGDSTTYTYDHERRIIQKIRHSEHTVTAYTYSGNTIQETITYTSGSGSTDVNHSIHYLNNFGMIDSTVNVESGQTHILQYNTQGYLTRALIKGSSGAIQSGYSYTYLNGNRVADYNFTINGGQIIDSSVFATYTHYPNMKGSMEGWQAWIDRTGRPNANAIKSGHLSMNNLDITYTCTYDLGPNNLPSRMNLSLSQGGEQSTNYTWICY